MTDDRSGRIPSLTVPRALARGIEHGESVTPVIPSSDPVVVRRSQRFRQVSNRYPHMVAIAHDRDLECVARGTDDKMMQALGEQYAASRTGGDPA